MLDMPSSTLYGNTVLCPRQYLVCMIFYIDKACVKVASEWWTQSLALFEGTLLLRD